MRQALRSAKFGGALGEGLSFEGIPKAVILTGRMRVQGDSAQRWRHHTVPYHVPLVVDVKAALTLDPGCTSVRTELGIESRRRRTAHGHRNRDGAH